MKNTVLSNADIEFKRNIFGCSTISAVNSNNDKMFGRNFDWNSCEALIVKTKPSNGYSSISTVNMDFIKSGTGLSLNLLPDNIKTIAALYAPLDSVSKDNFNEYESTEWSIVFNQTSGEVIYYHRENYDNGYIFNAKDGD